MKREAQREASLKVQRQKTMRSVGIWGGVLIVILLGFWGLIRLGGSSIELPPLSVDDVSSEDHVLGPEGAPVTLIEYADFQCPACASAHPVVKELLDAYGANMRYVYRHFPLTQIHPYAMLSAEASEAAAKQGAFFAYHDLLFERQAAWTNVNARATLISYAEELQLDVDQFVADLNSREAQDRVEHSLRSALNLRLNSTPTFYLNGEHVQVSSYQELEAKIQEAIRARYEETGETEVGETNE